MDTFNEKYLGAHSVTDCLLHISFFIVHKICDIRYSKVMLSIFNQKMNKFWQHREK